MNKKIILTIALFLIIKTPMAFSAPPHLDLEMTGAELRAALKQQIRILGNPQKKDPLQIVLDLGVRNLDWLKFINQSRDEAHKLSFTSAATQRGIPITAPNHYNPTIILNQYQDLTAKLPVEIKDVLLNNKPFTNDPPIAEDQYLDWGRNIDRVYSLATRWLMMEPYLGYLEYNKREDVRGYYFLTNEPNLNNELTNWTNLPSQDQNRLKPWLINICLNSGNSSSSCATELETAIQNKQVLAYHQEYYPNAKALWDSFFSLDIKRDDIRWANDKTEALSIPFLNPNDPEVSAFLMNIEDEWHWQSWQLKLQLQTGSTFNTPHVVFEPGVTPHVNGIGGNEITMDANQPLTEYNVRWTIRHEFGHVLGFKDCYVEFYEDSEQAIINYQLDIDNLMCSRRGKLKEIHYDELKRVYAGKN